jgi:cytochrome b pre-mRNA-processing protein 3
MIFRLFRRGPAPATIAALYGTIVAQARNPAFYLAFGVPDTAEGRFDLIVLHLALVCRRLGREAIAVRRTASLRSPMAGEASARDLSQHVFDAFCADMDRNLREMGVGDLSVPKKMRRMGEAFYGRLEVYDRALAAAGDADLASALGRNVLGQAAPSAPARRLAAYVRQAADRLDATPFAALAGAQFAFPDPDAIELPMAEVMR